MLLLLKLVLSVVYNFSGIFKWFFFMDYLDNFILIRTILWKDFLKIIMDLASRPDANSFAIWNLWNFNKYFYKLDFTSKIR